MKYLITGATGFLGQQVTRSLLEHTRGTVRLLSRSPQPAYLERLNQDFPTAQIEFLTGDLTDPEFACHATKGVEVVYHLAAGTHGNPSEVIFNTLVATDNLLRALDRTLVQRVVLVSSFAVYAVSQMRWNQVLTESSPLEPYPERRDPYTYAKARQERLVIESGLPLVIVRPGVIYGAGGSPISARVGLRIGSLFLHLGGHNWLPLTHVKNCADIVVLAGLKEGLDGQVFNAVDDELIRANVFRRAYGRHVSRLRALVIPYPFLWLLAWGLERYSRWSKGQLPAALTPYKVSSVWKPCQFDNSKAKQLLGWQPRVGLTEGLEQAFAFHRPHPTP